MTTLPQNSCGVSTCAEYVADGIQCNRCFAWYHYKCSKLTKREIPLHKQHTFLKWTCDLCNSLAEAYTRILKGALGQKMTETADKSVDSPRKDRTSVTKPSVTELKKKTKKKRAIRKTAKPAVPAENAAKGNPQMGCVTTVEFEILRRRVEQLENEMQVMMNRAKHLLIHNCAEPVIKEAKARRETERKHVQDVLRLAGLPPGIPYLKCHRVGVWKGTKTESPRPLRVIFTSAYSRDTVLARASKVEDATSGLVKVTPDTAYFLGLKMKPPSSAPGRAILKQPVVQVEQLEGEPLERSTPKPRTVRVVPPKPTPIRVPAKNKALKMGASTECGPEPPLAVIAEAPKGETNDQGVKPDVPATNKAVKTGATKECGSEPPLAVLTEAPKGEPNDQGAKPNVDESSTAWTSVVSETQMMESARPIEPKQLDSVTDKTLNLVEAIESAINELSASVSEFSRQGKEAARDNIVEKNETCPRVLRPRVHPA